MHKKIFFVNNKTETKHLVLSFSWQKNCYFNYLIKVFLLLNEEGG